MAAWTPHRLKKFVDPFWDDSILPSITEYIRIPNKSPAFDPQWVEHGYMEDAVKLMEAWAQPQLAGFPGATLEVVRLPGRTPLIFIEVPGDGDDTVLLYGHLDKQPEMKGWAEGMGPWIPVLQGRQALWPRRRRRRLCDLCLPLRAERAARAEGAARRAASS